MARRKASKKVKSGKRGCQTGVMRGKKSKSDDVMMGKLVAKPLVAQRFAQAVKAGKIKFTKVQFTKLKSHKGIIRRLADMRGNVASKRKFVERNKKQIGGFLPFLPMILAGIGAAGSLAGGISKVVGAVRG